MQKNKNIAFVIPYPLGESPSQRFRFEQYFNALNENEINFSCFPFLTKKDYKILYLKGKFFRKSVAIIRGFIKRLLLLFKLSGFDVVFVHREASPIGFPFFEWVVSKGLKKHLIYDFDDSIWLANTSQSNKAVSLLKAHSKVAYICSWATLVICGNHFLMAYAEKYNVNVKIIPTTIDLANGHNKIKTHNDGRVMLGWTGTHSTIKYLFEIESLLAKLQREFNFSFVVISDKDPNFFDLKYNYIPWNKKNEINDLIKLDIGIMPLVDNDWSKGKCGFKGLQYMALEIPTIMSPIGVNIEIIADGINGFLASTETEWENKLTQLIESKELRSAFGKEGRLTVKTKYSVEANEEKYLTCFKELVKT